jgi:signal transduction histidine kinase
VVVVGPDNRLILINPSASEAFGVSQPNATGQLFDSAILNAQARSLFNGQTRGGEIQLEDGRVFNAHVTPIASVGRALVMQDITHLKKLDRIKSEFVTAVSHDLRSPLTAILGYVDLIQRGGPVNEQQGEFIARVRQSVHAINSLITDLLDLGRIEAGFDTQKEPTSLAAVARYAVDAFKPQADAKQQILVVSLPEGLPRVYANTLRLRQMVANLMDNAIKYTPPGGDVHVTVSADGDQLLLMVSDGGIGIAPADQPYIFDKFYRASNVRVGYAGTGLGLSIVKSIVEAHSGRIWLDSKLNQGTTFTVVLPTHKE